jgi:G6PDH family F420-dependent oxidoreductase
MRIGLFLSCEEYSPEQLLAQARKAADLGFSGFWISDHFHPWLDSQGQSPFVWSMIGALSQISDLPVTTAVTCPTTRIHPAIIAQAAATCAVLTKGRFQLGLGTGEALNESIAGQVWPPAGIRLEMLEEAIELMRELWTGKVVTHTGKHYTLHHARLYTRPEEPPPVYISAYGPKAIELAARLGDGYVSTRPDAELTKLFRDKGGAGKPMQGGAKACLAPTEQEAAEIAHKLWRSSGLPGEMGQVLPTPEHFEQASELVTPEMMRKEIVCGPDPAAHLANARKYAEAGFDELYVAPVGPNDLDMIDFYAKEILPEFG